MRSIILLILLLSELRIGTAQVDTLTLASNWKFRQAGKLPWMHATVPGTVHTDLVANKKIPDPFLEKNELLVQ